MTTRSQREMSNGKADGVAQGPQRLRNAREAAENSPAAQVLGLRAPREGRQERQEREDPAESVVMSVPPRNRWQVLMVEYELLDSYVGQVSQRVWTSGLVLIGLSLLGLASMGTLKPGLVDTARVVALVGGIGSVLAVGWWVLLRRLFLVQRVAEYRRDEIERELGLRSGLYLTFLRQSRRIGSSRNSAIARQLSEGDAELEGDLRDLSKSPAAKARIPRFLSDKLIWSLAPWLLIAAWVGMYFVKL